MSSIGPKQRIIRVYGEGKTLKITLNDMDITPFVKSFSVDDIQFIGPDIFGALKVEFTGIIKFSDGKQEGRWQEDAA